jgi:glucan phosphoethanolaminetransferase (alkaline phosphatase superfamily)
MIKLFDFAYYYIYQLNRKGYKKNNHEYAQGFLGMVVGTFLLESTFLFRAFFNLISFKSLIAIIGLCAAITYISVYYFAGKLYGSDGPRKHIVKEYDSKYSYKKQNKYLQTFILWFLAMIWMAFCVILGIKIKKWMAL